MKEIKREEIAPPRFKPNWCGPGTLAALAKEQGLPIPDQEWLAKELKIDWNWGTDGEQMEEGVRLLGLEGKWFQNVSLETLGKMRRVGYSIILSHMAGPSDMEDGHYALLYDVTENMIAVNDSEWIGCIKVYRREDFERIFYDVDEEGERQERWALVVAPMKKDNHFNITDIL